MTLIPKQRAHGHDIKATQPMEIWPAPESWEVRRSVVYDLPRATVPHNAWPEAGSESASVVDDSPVHLPQNASARVFSALALLGLLALLAKLALIGYDVVHDSFVAPLILSPDSDAVLPSKMNLARLQAERATLLARIDQASAALRAAEAGAEKLRELKRTVGHGLDFTHSVTSETVRSSTRGMSALSEQRRLLEERVAQQESHVAELTRQLEAGLIRRADLERERDVLNQLRVAALQNKREQLASSVQHHASSLTQRALSSSEQGDKMSTPEMVQQKEQLIRIELDLLKLEAEQISKRSELRTSEEELKKLDGLVQQVKDRPVFRAIDSRQNVAFVPYTQLDGVKPGAAVYACEVWGLLHCKKVGSVSQVLPGEVATQDPWGAVARGQYALLSLQDGSAGKEKVLRVRRRGPLFDFDLRGSLPRFWR